MLFPLGEVPFLPSLGQRWSSSRLSSDPLTQVQPLPGTEPTALCSLEGCVRAGTQFCLSHSHVIPASNLVSGP